MPDNMITRIVNDETEYLWCGKYLVGDEYVFNYIWAKTIEEAREISQINIYFWTVLRSDN